MLIKTKKEKLGEENKEKSPNKESIDWNRLLIINPKSIYYRIYSVIIVMLRIISSLVYMSFAAFRHDVEGSEHIYHDERYFEIRIQDYEI